MAGLSLSTPEQQAAAQKLLREEVRPPEQVLQNVGLATRLEADALLSYRGQLYTVRPVPYPEGLALQEIRLHIEKLSKVEDRAVEEEDTDTLHQIYQQFAEIMTTGRDLFWRLVVPPSLFRRLLWRWTSNPFTNCSQAEFGGLLNFFSSCRMRSSVMVVENSVGRPSLSSRTLPTTLPPTSKPTLVQDG
jgi:hypothetical protein